MAIVMNWDGSLQMRVKNLRWLLDHWSEVERLEWSSLDDKTRERLKIHPITDGIFQAVMRDGRVYETLYASFDVWQKWINRPVFRGLPAVVNGITGKI